MKGFVVFALAAVAASPCMGAEPAKYGKDDVVACIGAHGQFCERGGYAPASGTQYWEEDFAARGKAVKDGKAFTKVYDGGQLVLSEEYSKPETGMLPRRQVKKYSAGTSEVWNYSDDKGSVISVECDYGSRGRVECDAGRGFRPFMQNGSPFACSPSALGDQLKVAGCFGRGG